MKKSGLAVLLICVVVLICGCGKMKPMSGQVTYDDGSPLTLGTVVFQTATYQARGNLDDKGHYQISSITENDGLPVGTYSVFVTGTDKELGYDKNGMPTGMVKLVDPKFNGPESGITFTVDGKTNTFDFKVGKKPAQKK